MNFYTTNSPTGDTSSVSITVPLALTLNANGGITITPSTETLASATEGVLYYDIATHQLRYHTQNEWLNLTLVAGSADSLADKRNPTHIASNIYRETATEHKYVSPGIGLNEWKAWSTDGFVDFRKPFTFTSTINFSSTTILNGSINMTSHVMQNIKYPALPSDIVIKSYVDSNVTKEIIKSAAERLLLAMITQVKSEHDRLLALWTERRSFKNGGTSYPYPYQKMNGSAWNPNDLFYNKATNTYKVLNVDYKIDTTQTAHDDYWLGAGLLTALTTTTRRLKNAGRI